MYLVGALLTLAGVGWVWWSRMHPDTPTHIYEAHTINAPTHEDEIVPNARRQQIRYKGKVKWYDSKLRYGFLKHSKLHSDVFFHINSVTGRPRVGRGVQVCFNLLKSARGYKAINVVITGKQSPNTCNRPYHTLACVENNISIQQFQVAVLLQIRELEGEVDHQYICDQVHCGC